jgi:hypothetical protein
MILVMTFLFELENGRNILPQWFGISQRPWRSKGLLPTHTG